MRYTQWIDEIGRDDVGQGPPPGQGTAGGQHLVARRGQLQRRHAFGLLGLADQAAVEVDQLTQPALRQLAMFPPPAQFRAEKWRTDSYGVSSFGLWPSWSPLM